VVNRSVATSVASGFLYSTALGAAAVAVPLLAASRGFSVAEIGFIVALSALSQMAVRIALPSLMRITTEAGTIVIGCALLAAGCAWFAASANTTAFVCSQALLGASRACFFTGSQTQAVRHLRCVPVQMAALNTSTGTGQLVGPTLAGLLGTAVSLTGAILASAGIAVAAIIPTVMLERHPRAVPPGPASSRGIWREPGVLLGSWAGVTAGSWRAVLNSFVPAVLQSTGMRIGLIGVLLSLANGAGVAASALSVRVVARWSTMTALLAGTVLTGAGIGAIGVASVSLPAVAVALVVGGFGAGIVQTVGPNVTTERLAAWQKGNGIAVAGLFRAGALFGAPLAVAGALVVVPFSLAAGLLGLALTAPTVVVRRRTAHWAPPGTTRGNDWSALTDGSAPDDVS
jgi:hypothetical protein